jgi:hypothetical protein
METIFANLNLNVVGLLWHSVNFLVLLGALWLLFFRPITRVLDERQRRVQESLMRAAEVEQLAVAAEDDGPRSSPRRTPKRVVSVPAPKSKRMDCWSGHAQTPAAVAAPCIWHVWTRLCPQSNTRSASRRKRSWPYPVARSGRAIASRNALSSSASTSCGTFWSRTNSRPIGRSTARSGSFMRR